MNKLISLFLALTLIILANTELNAQTRISFKKGTSSATVNGKIGVKTGGGSGDNYRTYIVRAKANQKITATVTSGNKKVLFTDNDRTSYSVTTRDSGDYDIRIYNGGINSTNYSITVSIR